MLIINTHNQSNLFLYSNYQLAIETSIIIGEIDKMRSIHLILSKY